MRDDLKAWQQTLLENRRRPIILYHKNARPNARMAYISSKTRRIEIATPLVKKTRWCLELLSTTHRPQDLPTHIGLGFHVPHHHFHVDSAHHHQTPPTPQGKSFQAYSHVYCQ